MNWFQKFLMWIGRIEASPVTKEVIKDTEALINVAGPAIVAAAPVVAPTLAPAITFVANDVVAPLRKAMETNLEANPSLTGIHLFIDTVSKFPSVRDMESKFLAAADLSKQTRSDLISNGNAFVAEVDKLVNDAKNQSYNNLGPDISAMEATLKQSKDKLAAEIAAVENAGQAIKQEFSVIMQNIRTHIK